MNADEDIQAAINNAGDIGVPYIPDITESEYKAANSDVRRIALERDRMRHALKKIEAESHDARAVDYAEAALS